ncbi:tellurite resistance protein TehB [Roseivivax jejudonensis]|uniref:Tellurite resistance protein TehB n=1 Tax=Roseivivax jejudonensis TaxID=1529041 RepID=A0A1X6ZWS7_9RHOB|nr:class I SAM-dependent methyltransferase [Roseivivax jejudonensis]SLN64035.1 tellurite resistance protein TehB [Roseivivax jejudonensis]
MSELERWEGRFAAEEYVFGTAPNAFLSRQADLLKPGMRALSIADGEGRNGVWLAEQGLEVTWQDFSPRAQDKAQALARARGVTLDWVLCDLEDFAFPDAAYDVVVGVFFQFLAPEARARVFAGMRRALKPGGLLLIEGYGPKQLDYGTGGPKALENLYTEPLLREAFGDMADCRIMAYDAEVSEGAGHAGMSALVDLVAWK